MADNVKIIEPASAPAGYSLSQTAAKEIGGAKVQRIIPTFEVAGVQTDVGPGVGLPVEIADGKLGVLGAQADAAATVVTGARSAIALLKAIAAWTLAPVLAAGEAHIGQVGGDTAVVAANFNRPADAVSYTVGDLVANATASGSVAPMELAIARRNGGTGRISRARLTKSGTSLTGAIFRVHLFRTAPVVQGSSGDNLAILSDNASGYIGGFDVAMDRAFSDGAKGIAGPSAGATIAFQCPSDSAKVFALIEARSTYAPVAGETFTLALEVDRD